MSFSRMRDIFEAFTLMALVSISVYLIHLEFTCSYTRGLLNVESGNSTLYLSEYDMLLHGLDRNGVTYFFLPSYIDNMIIEQNDTNSSGRIYCKDGLLLSKPVYGKLQDVDVDLGDGVLVPWKIAFFHSSGLYTACIDLKGADIDSIEHDTYIPSELILYSPRGNIEYSEKKIMMKGRGNATWKAEKQPYEIKLPINYPLCGMKRASEWALLANFYDETKILNKMTFDLSSYIGMEYPIESDWIDLYVNGEYMGNYLLCHEPDIGSGNVDIGNLTSFNRGFNDEDEVTEIGDIKGYNYHVNNQPIPKGGYLIEKDFYHRYKKKNKCGFIMGDDCFIIRSPSNASLDEVGYVRDFIEAADKKIHGESEEQLDMIDAYSFARMYLIMELSLDPDTSQSSCFFYKKPNADKLYAGPCWDFDMAYGNRADPIYKNYTASVFEIHDYNKEEDGYIALDWDRYLIDNAEYYEYLRSLFYSYSKEFNRLLSYEIDNYYDRIHNSVVMDYIRWEGYEGYEEAILNSYRHLKFFVYHRLKHMANEYGEEIDIALPDIYNDSFHKLTFLYEDGKCKEMMVKDGDQLFQSELPEFDHSQYDGWRMNDEYLALLSYYDPIFENRELVLSDYE